MKILKRVSSLQNHLDADKKKKKTIGFIPTMGALHKGHMSLVEASNLENDITVVSVFVNPTQFNQKEDLEKYPRDLDKDSRLLDHHDCDYLFAPSVGQIYPEELDTTLKLDISHLTRSMEGPNRPGHFEGMVQVVYRLMNIIGPDNLYMGQKDFQQFTIVNHMIESFKLKTKLRVCPIIREKDGLAMSSRNVRLKKSIRPYCNILFKALNYAKTHLKKRSIQHIEKEAHEMLSVGKFTPEYFNIVDGYTLTKVKNEKEHQYIVACTAVWADNVRLIDNMILKGDTFDSK